MQVVLATDPQTREMVTVNDTECCGVLSLLRTPTGTLKQLRGVLFYGRTKPTYPPGRVLPPGD